MLKVGPLAPGTIPSADPKAGLASVIADKPKLDPPIAAFASDEISTKQEGASSSAPSPTAKVSGPEVIGPSVRSEFPLDDLSKLITAGRTALGFRLDGGSIRRMWLSAKRTVDASGKPGVEINFQAQGASIETFRRRLEQAGATAGAMRFNACELDDSVEGKHALRKTGQDWGPHTQKCIHLEGSDSWSADMVVGDPEALRGAIRLTLVGDDASATASLGDAIKRLGLQGVFAPPSPTGLERFKLLQFLWQERPELIEPLRARPISELIPKLADTLALVEVDAKAQAELTAAKLDTPEMKRRGQLLRLIYERSPKRFFEWAKTGGPLVLKPGQGEPSTAIETKLKDVGLELSSPAVLAAKKAPPDPDTTRALLELALLYRADADAATSIAARDLEALKVAELKSALTTAGIDPARAEALRFEEVYPGYFTVIDPALETAAFSAGARYLYSTLDDPGRVLATLRHGQKSSLTRFAEGQLILGKSSGSDFESGGASSVFTRLVTRSAIENASKLGASGSTDFNDWGGSRPYKLVLNRRLLSRTDWYGYTSDSYGRTTTLTPANRGATIVGAIDQHYGPTNEVMFPIGNDPSYIDYIVAPTEEKKQELLAHLDANGIKELHGAPIADRVLVRKRLFEHPDDETLATVVRDAIYGFDFGPALAKQQESTAASISASLGASVPKLIDEQIDALAPELFLERLGPDAESKMRAVALTALEKAPELLAPLEVAATIPKLEPTLIDAAQEEAMADLRRRLGVGQYQQTEAVTKAAGKAIKALAVKRIDELLHAAVDAVPLGSGNKDQSWKIREALRKDVREQLSSDLLHEIRKLGEKAALASLSDVDTAISGALDSGLRAARTAATAALAGALDPSLLGAAAAAALKSVGAEIQAAVTAQVNADGATQLSYGLLQKLRPPAEELAATVAAQAIAPAVIAELGGHLSDLGQAAAKEHSKRHPGAPPAGAEAIEAEVGAWTQRLLIDSARSTAAATVKEPLRAATLSAGKAYLEKAEKLDAAVGTLVSQRGGAAAEAAVLEAAVKAVSSQLEPSFKTAVRAQLEENRAAVVEQQIEKALSAALESLLSTVMWERDKRFEKAAEAIVKRHEGHAAGFFGHLFGGF